MATWSFQVFILNHPLSHLSENLYYSHLLRHNSNHLLPQSKISFFTWHPDPLCILNTPPVNKNSSHLYNLLTQYQCCCGLLVLSYISHTMLCFAQFNTFLWDFPLKLFRPLLLSDSHPAGSPPGVSELPPQNRFICLVASLLGISHLPAVL